MGREQLLIKTFGSDDEELTICEFVKLSLKSLHDISLNAYAVPVICSTIYNQPVEFAVQRYNHLKGLTLAEDLMQDSHAEINTLLGSDQIWNFLNGQTIRRQGGPVAVSTKFGYVLSGPVNNVPFEEVITNFVTAHALKADAMEVTSQEILDSHMKHFYDLETLGISSKEVSVHEEFLDDIKFNGKRYSVKLPFKETPSILMDNYNLSLNRLKGLIKCLKADPGLFQEYNSVMKEQCQRGILEDVDLSQPTTVGRVHYLSVVRKDKSTSRVRIVYDASSKATSDSPSLNDVLYPGPSLIPAIIDILIRFRWHNIGLTSDIEKAFLNIEIAEEHRDILRMLWIDDIFTDNLHLLVKRFERVVFALKPSPFLLNRTVKHHISKYELEDPQFVAQFLASIYVDDLISGNGTVPEAFQFYLKATERLLEAGLIYESS